ncbi:MAG TPA: erythromycin esterase family protein [Nitriliruptorales bacterium]|nr:erythromycin esterase family protein [Nitriliruptorales bacterium]
MTTERLRAAGRPLDLDGLAARLADAELVLLGEATHGTHEFYAVRADLTRRLIAGHGFAGVAVEADWPDAARVTRYVAGEGDDPTAAAALGDFTRFPTWMWRNTVVAGFVGWLAEHNTRRRTNVPVGFHGLDLYSLYTSIEAVVRYLDEVDVEAAQRARLRYACFDHAGVDGQRYGYATAVGAQEPCEGEVVAQLVELRRRAGEDGGRAAAAREWAFFDAEQNARLVADAERYYRAMFRGRDDAWNLRDTHMADTLDALLEHLGQRLDRPKVVVWAHNSHLGDARATEMGERRGELNLGQLARERHGDRVVNVGFTTYAGEVTAAADWDGPTQRQRVRDALPGCYEAALHDAGLDRAWLDLHDAAVASALAGPRLERAIGVVYRPDTERVSHYFSARLPRQFDVVIHLDDTRALEPLDRTSVWDRGAVEATYPWAV